ATRRARPLRTPQVVPSTLAGTRARRDRFQSTGECSRSTRCRPWSAESSIASWQGTAPIPVIPTSRVAAPEREFAAREAACRAEARTVREALLTRSQSESCAFPVLWRTTLLRGSRACNCPKVQRVVVTKSNGLARTAWRASFRAEPTRHDGRSQMVSMDSSPSGREPHRIALRAAVQRRDECIEQPADAESRVEPSRSVHGQLLRTRRCGLERRAAARIAAAQTVRDAAAAASDAADRHFRRRTAGAKPYRSRRSQCVRHSSLQARLDGARDRAAAHRTDG